MTQRECFQSIYEIMQHIPKETLNLSLADVHHPGLFSLVIKGTEFGNLTRVFIAHQDIKPNGIQFHSHRYPIKLTAVCGTIKHYTAKELPFFHEIDCNSVKMSKFAYKSPMNGGTGLRYLEDIFVNINSYILPNGSTLLMDSNEIHTVSCKKGSIWVVEECGFETDESIVLGVPFIVDNLYNSPTLYQTNDNYQLVLNALKNILVSYKSIN